MSRGREESFMTVAPAARPSGAPAANAPAPQPAKKPVAKPTSLAQMWPEIWALVRPRRGKIALGFVLMGVNRVSGLVLPWSTKSLIDDVIGKHQAELLMPLVGGVLAATAVQGA